MNPNIDPIYAGLAGIRLGADRIELGHGVLLQRTYAHFMAPYLMAFSPAEPGKPHPAPWRALSGGGLAIDMHVELFIPENFSPPNFFDRLNTVWWIASLLRLRNYGSVHVPAITSQSFASAPKNEGDAQILPIEVMRRPHRGISQMELTADDALWLRETWFKGAAIMNSSSEFNDAYQAIDSAFLTPQSSLALITLWGALEHLFSPAKQELRFRVSANIAAYLEPAGSSRLELQRKLLKLYDFRSKIAHGAGGSFDEALIETMTIAKAAISKMIDKGAIPTKDQLDAMLCGVN